MTADRKARADLRNALVNYMTGEIQTFAFDDQNSAFWRTADSSVQQISRLLYRVHDEEQWHANECLVDGIGLPEYDPVIHGRRVNPWWNRIPSSIGFAIIAGVIGAVMLALFFS